MKITTDHPTSSYGIPVIIDDAGQVMDYGPGVKAIRRNMGLNTNDFGSLIGVSGRTVEGWEQGKRMPGKPELMLISQLIKGE